MRDRVFRLRVHLGKGEPMSLGHEDRVIAESELSARRKVDGAIRPAFEDLRFGSGRRQSQRAYEMRALVRVARSAHLVFDALHGDAEILLGSRPACGMDARRAVECRNRKPRVIREGWKI